MTRTWDDLQPFKVARDGTVTHRAAGHIIGRVYLDSQDGWVGDDVEGKRINSRLHWNGRKYAARAVWEAYQKRVAVS